MTNGEFPKRETVPIIGEKEAQNALHASQQKELVNFIKSQASEHADPLENARNAVGEFQELCLKRASQFEAEAIKIGNSKGSLQVFHMLVGQAEAYRIVHSDLGNMVKNVETKPADEAH